MVSPSIIHRLEVKGIGLPTFSSPSFSALSSSDIAAGLGYVTNPLHQAILSYCYWPTGANYAKPLLQEKVINDFESNMCAAHASNQWNETLPDRFKKRQEFPVQVAELILSQIRGPSLCAKCGGHKQVLEDTRIVSCRTCGGTGVKVLNTHETSRKLRVRTQDFLRYIAKPYDMTYEDVSVNKTIAIRTFVKVMG